MQNMQPCTGNPCQPYCQLRRCTACCRGADVGMLAYGNIILSGKHFLILGNIVLDGFLVFAVGGNQHVCTVEDVQQAVHLVYQHVSGTGAHE